MKRRSFLKLIYLCLSFITLDIYDTFWIYLSGVVDLAKDYLLSPAVFGLLPDSLAPDKDLVNLPFLFATTVLLYYYKLIVEPM